MPSQYDELRNGYTRRLDYAYLVLLRKALRKAPKVEDPVLDEPSFAPLLRASSPPCPPRPTQAPSPQCSCTPRAARPRSRCLPFTMHMRLRQFRNTHDVQTADIVALANCIFALFLVSSHCASNYPSGGGAADCRAARKKWRLVLDVVQGLRAQAHRGYFAEYKR